MSIINLRTHGFTALQRERNQESLPCLLRFFVQKQISTASHGPSEQSWDGFEHNELLPEYQKLRLALASTGDASSRILAWTCRDDKLKPQWNYNRQQANTLAETSTLMFYRFERTSQRIGGRTFIQVSLDC